MTLLPVCRWLIVLAVLLAMPAAANAQRPPRVGVVMFGTPETEVNLAALRSGLRDLGHVEGQSIVLEYGAAQGRPERLSSVIAGIASTKPDAIFALGGDVALVIKQVTVAIPTVALLSLDPVEAGLVVSLARPGGNITGVAFVSSEIVGKRLQYVRAAMPAVSRVGLLWNPDHPDPEYRGTVDAGRALGIRVTSLEVRKPEDFEAAFDIARRERLEVLVVAASRLMNLNRQRVMDFAGSQRIAVVSGWGPWVVSGALLSYGPDLDQLTRRAAGLLDRVLKGTRPTDIPVELPTKFDLVLNAKTARSLGIVLPPSLLLQAQRVVE